MRLNTDDYREAARERLGDARVLYDESRWSSAAYLAGRSAEAMLRAIVVLRTRHLDEGHDLKDLLRRTRLVGLGIDRPSDPLHDAVNELAVVWHNNLRFAGPSAFVRHLRSLNRLIRIGGRKVLGDPSKANAKSVLEAAERVVSRGEVLWKRSKRG